MSEHNMSASGVKTHSQCALQWQFSRQSDKEPTKKKSKYLNLGSRVHESIEEALNENPPLGHETAVRATIQNKFEDKDEYPLPQDSYEDGLDYCAVAAEYIAKREPSIVDIERRKEYKIERDDIETGVTAIMDVTTEDEIWDWKTGSIRDETPHEEKIQGSIYMAAFYEAYEKPPEMIRFIYLKEEKVRSIKPGDEIWEYMLDYAKELIESKRTGEFPANPGDHCYFCGWEYFCPEAPVGVGNVPWSDY